MSLFLYPKLYSSLTTILQCCSGLCRLQHGQQAFLRQNAAPSQIETHLRMKEVQIEQGSRDRVVIRFRSLKLVFRTMLEAFSECSSLTTSIRKSVYIRVRYQHPKQSLYHEEEATIRFKSWCKNNPTATLIKLTGYLQIHSGRGPAMSSPSSPCIGSSGTFSRS